MTDQEFIQEAARRGYMLVPIPEQIDHDLRPGDRVVEALPDAYRNIATRLEAKHGSKLFNMDDQAGTVLAVASRADVLWKRDDGRVIFGMARGLRGEPSVQRVSS